MARRLAVIWESEAMLSRHCDTDPLILRGEDFSDHGAAGRAVIAQ